MAVVEEDASAGDAVVCPVVDAAAHVGQIAEKIAALGLCLGINVMVIQRDLGWTYTVVE